MFLVAIRAFPFARGGKEVLLVCCRMKLVWVTAKSSFGFLAVVGVTDRRCERASLGELKPMLGKLPKGSDLLAS